MMDDDGPTQGDLKLYVECYIEWWKKAFKSLMGWTESEVLHWAAQHEPRTHGEFGVLFNGGPARAISFELIPEDLRHDGYRSLQLQKEIFWAIDYYASIHDPSYSWDSTRQRVDQIIEGYRIE